MAFPDTPHPDEIALIFCLANRGLLNARVGGLTQEEVFARAAVSTDGAVGVLTLLDFCPKQDLLRV